MPKVSIITPVYCDVIEKCDWLLQTIDSVMSQSMTDWEMILIDDRSPFEPSEAMFKYAEDSRIRWVKNAKQSGPSLTRNTAVALAESNCILPLDSDDMLASPEVLETMYDVWSLDRSKIVYGNLQMYKKNSSGNFELGSVIELGQYSFTMAMDLTGIMPVTCMHSKDCHYRAVGEVEPGVFKSGWKPQINMGLEDVEYWVAAGKSGFCGVKIDMTTLIYRQQQTSRAYKLKHVNRQFEEMQYKIKDMHKDIYSGRYPMACCGKGGQAQAPDPVLVAQKNASQSLVTTSLRGPGGMPVDEKSWVWVKYNGRKSGSFSKISHNTQISYQVLGPGHVFPIHQKDESVFRQSRDPFMVGIPDPRVQPLEEEKQPEPRLEAIAPPPPPEAQPDLSVIERLDPIGSRTREAVVLGDVMPEAIPAPAPAPVATPPPLVEPVKSKLALVDLDMRPHILQVLRDNGWIVEDLATATPQELIELKGIGIKTAEMIVERARGLVG